LVVATATRILPAGFEPRVEAYLGKNLSLAAWIRWDAWWYLSVVERGYWFDPHGKSNVAFFPLFPALVRGVAAMVGNPLVAGLLVANAAALGAILALWWWVEREAGPHAGERAALWLLVYLFSFFFHSLYAESLFFLLATLALGTAARDRWVGAGAWGALAAATRPMGVLLAPALLWGLWRAARGQGRAALGSATSPAPCCPLWAWPPTCSSSGRPSVTRWPSGRRT
jgi:Gpi18-like mannosyltransferase